MRGVWTALITPFNEKNEIDVPAFKKILQDQISAGITGIIPCGTTGESPTLSLEEKKSLIQLTIQETQGTKVKVFAGTGSNNTAETVQFSSWASQAGVDGVLLVTPYYNKPSQAGLELHYRQVAEAVSCEVMLYNVPGRTGVSLSAETVVKLASHPRIRTVKEATGNPAITSEILELLNAQNVSIDILSGDDVTFLPLLSVGAVGVVSVASNLFPRAMVAIQSAAEAGNFQQAKKIHQKYYPLFRDLFIDANPVPVKYAMEYAGWCRSFVRSPLVGLSPAHQAKLQTSFSRCEISPGRPA